VLEPGVARWRANLGEALRLLGRHDEALDQLRAAEVLDPGLAQIWNSRGLVAYDRGNLQEAAAAYREAIRRDARFSAAYINLANVLRDLHRDSDAALSLREAIRIDPSSAIALSNLGQVLCDLGDPDLLEEAEALCRRAIAVAPGLAHAFETLGNVLRATGRPEEALKSYQQSIRLDRRRAAPMRNIGLLLQQAGRFDEAAKIYDQVRQLVGDDPHLLTNLGALAAARGQHDLAVQQYRLAVERDKNCKDAHHGLGLALLEQARLGEAEASFLEALRIDPTSAVSVTALARIQAERGDLELSCRTARSALALRANLAEAYTRLTINLKGRLRADEVQAIERLLDHKLLTDAARAALGFGLAKVYDARGLYARSAALLERANRLQSASKAARGLVYDALQHSHFIDRFIATFTPEAVARARGWGDPDPRPVFVVGLPRSGTTLVEQILASHPLVHGAGELFDAHSVFQRLPELVGQPAVDSFQAFGALAPDTARAAARIYLERLDELAPAAALRVVDKMPDNLRLLGLIAVLWPRARVIMCLRDPRDVALSCWQTGFESNPWANDWDFIARRVADMERLTLNWRRTKPLDWLEVRYEALVVDLEGHARRLIDFVGLDWNPACLEFHKTRRVVRTASLAQVREPVHANSVGRWRRYEPFLHSLFEAFERHGVEIGKDP
jgi:tetratricopeptide (TPR) repeat protein